eukprot:4542785-Alexandrium_andersonii.AAC.1
MKASFNSPKFLLVLAFHSAHSCADRPPPAQLSEGPGVGAGAGAVSCSRDLVLSLASPMGRETAVEK